MVVLVRRQPKPPAVLFFLDRSRGVVDILFKKPEDSLVLSKSSYERLKELYSDESLDSDMARLREEMQLSIRDELSLTNLGLSPATMEWLPSLPIILMVVLAVGSHCSSPLDLMKRPNRF